MESMECDCNLGLCKPPCSDILTPRLVFILQRHFSKTCSCFWISGSSQEFSRKIPVYPRARRYCIRTCQIIVGLYLRSYNAIWYLPVKFGEQSDLRAPDCLTDQIAPGTSDGQNSQTGPRISTKLIFLTLF